MDMATRYIVVKQLNQKILKDINFARKKKEIYLPCELVEMNGKAPTECYIQISKKSQLKWSYFSTIEETITKAQEKI